MIAGPIDQVRLRHLAQLIHDLGPRALAELLAEVVEQHPEIIDRVEAFAAIDPAILRQLGADRFPPATLLVRSA